MAEWFPGGKLLASCAESILAPAKGNTMSTNRLFAFSAAAAALALGGAGSALAQDQATAADAGASYSAEIPAEYATHSYATEQTVESTVAPDGTVVETVTRTRRIPARAHHDRSDQPVPMMHHGYQQVLEQIPNT